MGIDGRDLMKKGKEPDAYESRAVRAVAFLFVAVPVAFLLAFTYWVGTWDMGPIHGGVTGGAISLVLTVGSLALVILFRKLKPRR